MIFRIIAGIFLLAVVVEGAPQTVVMEAEYFSPLKGSNFSFQEPAIVPQFTQGQLKGDDLRKLVVLLAALTAAVAMSASPAIQPKLGPST